MTVLKRKRKASQFEVFHHLYEMRRDLTNLLLIDFGLSPAKEERVLQKVLNGRDFDQLSDRDKERVIRVQQRIEGFHDWFISSERSAIVKLSSYWRYLQIQYSLTDTGRVIQKISPKAMTRMRRKMKKLVHILDPKDYQDWYQSWFRSHYKIMSKQQRTNLDALYKTLKETENGRQNICDDALRREQTGKPDLKWQQLYLYSSCRRKPVRRQAQERGHH